jgi:hypothetical protein
MQVEAVKIRYFIHFVVEYRVVPDIIPVLITKPAVP